MLLFAKIWGAGVKQQTVPVEIDRWVRRVPRVSPAVVGLLRPQNRLCCRFPVWWRLTHFAEGMGFCCRPFAVSFCSLQLPPENDPTFTIAPTPAHP